MKTFFRRLAHRTFQVRRTEPLGSPLCAFAPLRENVFTSSCRWRHEMRFPAKAQSRKVAVSLALVLCFAVATVQAQQGPEPLTNAAVIKLVRAGFKEKTVIAIIHSRPNRFDLSAEKLIELKHNGVNDNIVLAMISQDEMHFGSSDDLDDDAFFRRSSGSSRGAAGNQSKPDGGVDIFGSGGSAKGETRGRGANSSSQGDSITSGTATVRILRPPTEGGGEAAKLEKTPTLNNDSIIKLVDAGFSEGTIIKRIEDSPAEFDLSPAKLSELRKHRVTEPVIAAMTLAMGDDSNKKTSGSQESRDN